NRGGRGGSRRVRSGPRGPQDSSGQRRSPPAGMAVAPTQQQRPPGKSRKQARMQAPRHPAALAAPLDPTAPGESAAPPDVSQTGERLTAAPSGTPSTAHAGIAPEHALDTMGTKRQERRTQPPQTPLPAPST